MKERNRLSLQLAEKVDELATFYYLSNALQSTMELDGRLRTILKWVAAGGGFDRATLLLFDDEKDGVVTNGLTTDGCTISLLKGGGLALTKGGDANGGDGGLSVTIPLVAKGKSVGAIFADNSETRRVVTRGKRRFLEVLANMAALAIENARLHDNLRSLAVRDSLTGLFNRGRFDKQLETEVERAKRYNRPLSLVMIDLDHFKDYNDANGHLAGDKVLLKVARILEGEVRVADTVARYGGDEFVTLLPETAGEGALAFGERIRERVERSLAAGKSAGQAVGVTVCLGIASYPEHAHTAKGLIEKADRALYAAKQRGKNRVSCFTKSIENAVDKQDRSVVR